MLLRKVALVLELGRVKYNDPGIEVETSLIAKILGWLAISCKISLGQL